MAKSFETPKGTRDFLPEEMRLRSAVFGTLRAAFERFGYQELDTPAIEYLEVLTLKAGPQAEQEIYAFDDKAGRRLGLRFDLTSSTGRFAASHPELKRPIYRYQMGKVWRYDRPAAGRYREFYQADADIVGSYAMDCEVDLLQLADFVLRAFRLAEPVFVINHRQILEAQLRLGGISSEQKSAALRALDKLDKIGRDGVLEEAKKSGISESQYDGFLQRLGLDSNVHAPTAQWRPALQQLGQVLQADEAGARAVGELQTVFQKAEALGLAGRLRLDVTLARGLDYYTGPIFEAKAGPGLLSFAGGGRYDDLVGLYGGQPQGAVGFSFGVERLIELVKADLSGLVLAPRPVLMAPLSEAQTHRAAQLASALREHGIPVRMAVHPASPGKHLQYAEATGLAWVVLVGEQEVTADRYVVKNLATRTEVKQTPEEMQLHFEELFLASSSVLA